MIALRAMTREDADGVEAVERASFTVSWSRKSFWEEAVNEMARYVVAEEDGEVIGYAGEWIVAGEAQVMNVAVVPDRRGRGIGAMLVAALIDEAKARDAERMTLEVRPSNAHAIALYEKFGFKSAGRRPRYYLDNGEDALIMWKMKL